MKKDTAILVLAAGASTRFGSPKQLLPYRSATLLSHTLAQVVRLPGVTAYVVLGAFFDDIHQTIKNFPVQILKNSDWDTGLPSSIRLGVTEIQKEKTFGQVLITLADTPLFVKSHYRKLIQTHQKKGAGITATKYTNSEGVPVVFDQRYFDDLIALSGDKGAKSLLSKNKSDVSYYKSHIAFFDIDTQEAYQKLLDIE